MATGTVKFFNTTKGFGFIAPDEGGADLFVHISQVERADMQTLTEGQRLSFQVEGDAKGAKAVKLERLDAPAAGEPTEASRALSAEGDKLGLTLYHNPDCALSRNALAAVQDAGYSPRIVNYLTTPLTRDELKSLAARMKRPVRELARTYEPLYEELGLGAAANDDQFLDAMAKHPELVNRPILATENSARMCRPSTEVKVFLQEMTSVN